jgi:hypothetical protein
MEAATPTLTTQEFHRMRRASARTGIKQTKLKRSILVAMHPKAAFYTLLPVALLIGSACQSGAQEPGAIRFTQHTVDVYRGQIKIPREFHKDRDGLWQDETGKPASRPRVNFAGEYFLAVHSCGTCCRYYTLSNLRTGAEINEVGMFDASDGSPHVTRDGRDYVPILFFKPGSKLVIVQYELDLCTDAKKNECRQRYFIFENDHFKAISRTLRSCTRKGDEPE